MLIDTLAAAAALSDLQLLARVASLAGRERKVVAELIAHLAEVDVRRLHEAEGEDAAYTRIEVARAARRLPLILDHLGDGRLTLTTARLLAPHLTEENHRDVLGEASGHSKRICYAARSPTATPAPYSTAP